MNATQVDPRSPTACPHCTTVAVLTDWQEGVGWQRYCLACGRAWPLAPTPTPAQRMGASR